MYTQQPFYKFDSINLFKYVINVLHKTDLDFGESGKYCREHLLQHESDLKEMHICTT